MLGKTMEELQIGEEASFTKTVTETDIVLFGGLTGDLNPAHFNEEYAKTTPFKTRIAHGMLSATFISTVLGNYLPGYGSIYCSQELKFVKPVFIGDTVTATVKIIEKLEEKHRVVLETIVTNQRHEAVIIGKAIVMPPKKM